MSPSKSVPERLQIAPDGWCPDIVHIASPNFDARPAGSVIDLLVIHNISLPPGQFGGGQIADLFANRLDCAAHPYFEQLRALRVSAHFLIDRAGCATQFVAAGARAWHAGASVFKQRERCNDFSIGIELEGTDFQAFTDAQYVTLVALTLALERAYPLTDVTGHEHIAPGRKTDPGPFFDWPHYRALYLTNGSARTTINGIATVALPPGMSGDGTPLAPGKLNFCR